MVLMLILLWSVLPDKVFVKDNNNRNEAVVFGRSHSFVIMTTKNSVDYVIILLIE